MFWKHNSSSSSQIDTLLAKEDVTLQEVMDAEDIINDCRVQNKTLIDFLVKPEIMEELITLITQEPSAETEERSRYKYPNVACELLTCDIPVLNERLAADEALLERLYNFIDCEPPLNPLLASYFSKIMGALIAKKTEQNWLSYQFTCLQVLEFLKAKDNFISLLLKHLGTSAIMDLMLKIMTQVEGVETRQNILNWLDSQNVMQSLVSLLNPKVDKERQYNVAQLLCDFVRMAGDIQRNTTERADPDPLLNTLESHATMTLLLNQMLDHEKSESAIVGGIQVLLALLESSQNSIPKSNTQNNLSATIQEENDTEQSKYDPTESIRHRIKDFHNLLLDPPNKSSIETTVGLLDPPLGNTRLQIIKLLTSIISSNNTELLKELESLGTFPVLLDLFFNYPWNNFLHTQVENCLVSAFKTYESNDDDGAEENSNALCTHLLLKCKLIERIMDGWKKNDEQQAQENGIRQGYMGHLISIVNKLVELCSSTALGQYITANLPETAKSFDEFKETQLSEANKLQDTLLAGVYNPSTGEEGDMPLYIGAQISLSHSNAMQQQVYSHFQMQNINQYIDYSEFNDDAFNDSEDALQTIQQRPDLNFEISEGDMMQQHELFRQVCAQNINTLDDADDQIFEDREQTFQTVIEKDGHRSDTVYSSDSDDESPPGEDAMDIEPWTSPKGVANKDPWGTGDSNSPDSNVGGWADFSSATFVNNKNNAFNQDAKAAMEKDLKLENVSEGVEEMTTEEVKSEAKNENKEAKEEAVQLAAGDQTPEESANPPKECSEKPSKSIDNSPAVPDKPQQQQTNDVQKV